MTTVTQPTAADLGTAITNALAGIGPELLIVGGAGLALAFVKWGFPLMVGFFKRTAK